MGRAVTDEYDPPPGRAELDDGCDRTAACQCEDCEQWRADRESEDLADGVLEDDDCTGEFECSCDSCRDWRRRKPLEHARHFRREPWS